MKNIAHLKEHPWLPICFLALVAMFSVGCSSSRRSSDATTNPLAAYSTSISTSTSTGTIIDGTTIVPGSLNGPIISVQEDGSTSINGHDNAPLLDNKHVGWQQSNCLACHNEQTHNPDHNYSDDSLCYLCHGTNGLPGMSDTTPPVLTNVLVSPTETAVTISWKSDKESVSRLVLKTIEGDKMEFPVSSTYTTSHKKTISGLQSATTYYYELICIDKSGNKTSTSSFSNLLMFQTPAPATTVTVVDTDTGTDTGTEEEVDPFFTEVVVGDRKNGTFVASFKTKETPIELDFLLYKEDGKTQVYSDDIKISSTNVYTESICNTYQPAGNYKVKFKAILKGSSTVRFSSLYSLKLTD